MNLLRTIKRSSVEFEESRRRGGVVSNSYQEDGPEVSDEEGEVHKNFSPVWS